MAGTSSETAHGGVMSKVIDVEVGSSPDATFNPAEKDTTLTSTTNHEPTGTYHRSASTDDTSDEKSVVVIPPAPDGGLRAWLQVLSGHLVVFNAWGIQVLPRSIPPN